MALCHFSSFYDAMDAAQYLVGLDPVTVELIDDTMIHLPVLFPCLKTVADFVSGDPSAILVVEFAEETHTDNLAKILDLKKTMAELNGGAKKANIATQAVLSFLKPPVIKIGSLKCVNRSEHHDVMNGYKACVFCGRLRCTFKGSRRIYPRSDADFESTVQAGHGTRMPLLAVCMCAPDST